MLISDFLTETPAYHGSNHEFDEFSVDHIGSGRGYQTFGWGIYLTKERHVAQRYRSKGKGFVYRVDMPPEDEMLDWNLTLPQQSPHVQESLKRIGYEKIRQDLIDREVVVCPDDSSMDSGEDIYGMISCKFLDLPGDEYRKATSMLLAKAGVAGIRYFDVESGAKRNYNYVIFDPRRIKIIRKGQ